MANSDKTMKDLQKAVGRDFAKYTKDLHKELKAETPANTGTAQRGWKTTYQGQMNTTTTTNRTFNVEENRVNYIGVLDQKHRIVDKAANKTRR